jgi:glycogen operon protein
MRSMMTTLLTSLGTPMIVADEFGRRSTATTTPIARITRSAGSTGRRRRRRMAKTMIAFTARLAELRRRFVVLRAPSSFKPGYAAGHRINDIEWWDRRGNQLSPGWLQSEGPH